MYTSVVLLALASTLAPTAQPLNTPSWMRDYEAASARGRKENKPLAVVFGDGSAGWEQLCTSGKFGAEVQRLLASEYIPVYLDLGKEEGKSLASAFKVKEGPALVLSDRSGENIALRYTGQLESGDLQRCLTKYANPDRAVRTTDTDPNQEVRYYPPDTSSPASQPAYNPGIPNFGGFGGFGGGRGGC